MCEDEVHEMNDNPKMRFLTCIKMNEHIVSKGFGPNKKASKFAAAHILLNMVCPRIYKEWQEKVKSRQILTLAETTADTLAPILPLKITLG